MMASSTAMPIANTIAKGVDRLIVNPNAAMAANAPMMVTVLEESKRTSVFADWNRGHGHQHGAPVLQKHHDHDQHQYRSLEQRLPSFFDGLAQERGGVEGAA